MSQEMMNLPASLIPTCKVVEEARSWVGVKWRHQGRDRVHGIDCVGLIINVAHALGISDVDFTGYSRRSHGTDLKIKLKEHLTPIRPFDIGPGVVLVFREAAFPCHVGIVGNQRGVMTLIHAAAQYRKCTEELLTKHWWALITDVFKYPGVESKWDS